MKKKYALLAIGLASAALATGLLTLRDIRVKNELIETCGALHGKVSAEEMEEAIRKRYPQADEKKTAGSEEAAPNTDIWIPYAWSIPIGPTGVTQYKLGPLKIIRHKWHIAYIGKRAEEKYVTRGGSMDVHFGKYGFKRVSSQESSADSNCAIEKNSFTNWDY